MLDPSYESSLQWSMLCWLSSPEYVVLFMAKPFKGVPFKASTASNNQSTGPQVLQVILGPIKSGINVVKKHICTMFLANTLRPSHVCCCRLTPRWCRASLLEAKFSFSICSTSKSTTWYVTYYYIWQILVTCIHQGHMDGDIGEVVCDILQKRMFNAIEFQCTSSSAVSDLSYHIHPMSLADKKQQLQFFQGCSIIYSMSHVI